MGCKFDRSAQLNSFYDVVRNVAQIPDSYQAINHLVFLSILSNSEVIICVKIKSFWLSACFFLAFCINGKYYTWPGFLQL